MEDTTTEVMLLGGSPFAFNCTNTLQAQFIEALRNRLKLGSDSNGNGEADLLGVINLLNTGVYYVGSEVFKAKMMSEEPYKIDPELIPNFLKLVDSRSGSWSGRTVQAQQLPNLFANLLAYNEKSIEDYLDDIFKETGVKVTKHMHDEYIVEGSNDQVQSLLSQIRVLESPSMPKDQVGVVTSELLSDFYGQAAEYLFGKNVSPETPRANGMVPELGMGYEPKTESISTVRETNAKPVAPKLKVAKHKWKSDRRHFYDPDSVLEPCVCEVCGLRRYKVVAKQSKSGAKVLYATKYVMDQHVFHKAPSCTAP